VAEPTTTLATTTSAGPSTTEPTTTTEPAVLGGNQTAPVSAATVGLLVPVLGLLYLLHRLLWPLGGTHARRRGKHLRRG
jgi:hypothetical protein